MAMSARERQAKRRERIRGEYGKGVSMMLKEDARLALDRLCRHYGTTQAATMGRVIIEADGEREKLFQGGGKMKNDPKDDIEAKKMLISPSMAAKWLKGNYKKNRPIIRSSVEYLKQEIMSGTWRITNDAISFDRDGQLLNGQHRLTAIIETGKFVECIVCFDLPTDSFRVMDQGRKRSISDVLNISKASASVLRLATTILKGYQPISTKTIDVLMASDIYDASERLIGFCPTGVKIFSSAPVRLAAVLHICDGGDEDLVMLTYRALVSSSFDDMTPAAKSFYAQAFNMGQQTVPDMLARAFSVFRSGQKNITRVQVTDKSNLLRIAREIIRRRINEKI